MDIFVSLAVTCTYRTASEVVGKVAVMYIPPYSRNASSTLLPSAENAALCIFSVFHTAKGIDSPLIAPQEDGTTS